MKVTLSEDIKNQYSIEMKEDNEDVFLGILLALLIKDNKSINFEMDSESDLFLKSRLYGSYENHREVVKTLFTPFILDDDFYYIGVKFLEINIFYFYNLDNLLEGIRFIEHLSDSLETGNSIFMNFFYHPFNNQGETLYVEGYPRPAKSILDSYNYIKKSEFIKILSEKKERQFRKIEDVSKSLPAKGFY